MVLIQSSCYNQQHILTLPYAISYQIQQYQKIKCMRFKGISFSYLMQGIPDNDGTPTVGP